MQCPQRAKIEHQLGAPFTNLMTWKEAPPTFVQHAILSIWFGGVTVLCRPYNSEIVSLTADQSLSNGCYLDGWLSVDN